jgi:hypothetical protein
LVTSHNFEGVVQDRLACKELLTIFAKEGEKGSEGVYKPERKHSSVEDAPGGPEWHWRIGRR